MRTNSQHAKQTEKFVSRAAFEAMRRRVEDMEDRLELLQAQARGPGSDALPGAYVKRLLAGEKPLRVWRDFRGLTLDQLSASAKVSKTYLSEVETGKKPGSTALFVACAKVLGVALDDLIGD
jgi:hypothetical protein